MRLNRILLMTLLMAACGKPKQELGIEWLQSSALPAQDGQPHLGLAAPITGILNDQLLIAGGANFPDGFPWEGGKKKFQQQAYIYDISPKGLSLKKTLPWDQPLAYAALVNQDNVLYVLAGENEHGAVNRVSQLSLNDQQELTSKELATLPKALTNAGAAKVGNTLYLLGGENAQEVSKSVYSLDLDTPDAQWKELLELPYPLSNAVVLTDGKTKIYILGGRKRNEGTRSSMYDSVLELNLATQEIQEISKMPTALAAGSGLFLDGSLVLFSGDDATTFHKVEDALGEINKNEYPEKLNQLIASKNNILANHPGFSPKVWALNLEKLTWQELPSIPEAAAVTNTALRYHELIIIPSGEIRAGVRTDQIQMARIK